MNHEQHERPPLTTISTAGTYKLKLVKPKFEKIKIWEDGTASVRLFFVDEMGNCLSKSYGTKYTKALAMLIGKMTGAFAAEIRMDATAAELMQYLEPACGLTASIGVEPTHTGDWEGRPQYKYKLTFPKGSVKPTITDAPVSDPPF